MNLRPYQETAVERIREHLAKHRSTLLVLPTGCGKTVVFCRLALDYYLRGQRVLILAHRRELVEQAHNKAIATGMLLGTGIEMAGSRAKDATVVVASVQSMRGRLQGYPRSAFDLIIVDEAHHATAASYRDILGYFASAKVLGVTATPDRSDNAGLGKIFDSVAHEYSLIHAIRDGWLAPIRSKQVLVNNINLDKVRTTAGDLNQGDLSKLLRQERHLHLVVSPLVDLARDRKTLVFTADVAHAEAMARILNRYRPGAARAISGQSKERREILEAYRGNEFQYLVNCALLTEGWDEPSVECVAVARPTKSRALYAQMVGRGTRLFPGKADMLVLDFVGNSKRHRLINAIDILAGDDVSDELRRKAQKLIEADDTLDVSAALDAAKVEVEADRSKRNAKVIAVADYLVSEVDPFLQWDKPVPQDDGRNGFLTLPPWGQDLDQLRDLGFSPPEGITNQQVKGILRAIAEREKNGLCSYKQARFLRRHGYTGDTASLTKVQAGRLIGHKIQSLRARRAS